MIKNELVKTDSALRTERKTLKLHIIHWLCGAFSFVYWFIFIPVLWSILPYYYWPGYWVILFIVVAFLFWLLIVSFLLLFWWYRYKRLCKLQSTKSENYRYDNFEVIDKDHFNDRPVFKTKTSQVQPKADETISLEDKSNEAIQPVPVQIPAKKIEPTDHSSLDVNISSHPSISDLRSEPEQEKDKKNIHVHQTVVIEMKSEDPVAIRKNRPNLKVDIEKANSPEDDLVPKSPREVFFQELIRDAEKNPQRFSLHVKANSGQEPHSKRTSAPLYMYYDNWKEVRADVLAHESSQGPRIVKRSTPSQTSPSIDPLTNKDQTLTEDPISLRKLKEPTAEVISIVHLPKREFTDKDIIVEEPASEKPEITKEKKDSTGEFFIANVSSRPKSLTSEIFLEISPSDSKTKNTAKEWRLQKINGDNPKRESEDDEVFN